MRRGRYYLGRVIKTGLLDQDNLIRAITEAVTITVRKSRWTFTNVHSSLSSEIPFIFGRLAKYVDEGHVAVVDTETNSEVDAIAPNLLTASAPFVYLPTYSGLAYMHVWNHIECDTFQTRFSDIVKATLDHMFIGCDIEAISDYRQFGIKLKGLDQITQITARVHPPNPLFGRLWGSLNDYIAERNASELSIKESQEQGSGLETNIAKLVNSIFANPDYEPLTPIAIADAALLMAADGYGMGAVHGNQNGEEVIIRTSDTQKSFLFPKDPQPEVLAEEANKHLFRITKERDMRHP